MKINVIILATTCLVLLAHGANAENAVSDGLDRIEESQTVTGFVPVASAALGAAKISKCKAENQECLKKAKAGLKLSGIEGEANSDLK